MLGGQHDMAHAERAGAKTGDRTSGTELIGRGLGAMENLHAIADRVGEHDQVLHAPLVGERTRTPGDLHTASFEPDAERIERGRIRDFPAEETDAGAAVLIDDDALLAVVHAEREARRALVDALKAEQLRAVVAPIAKRLRANADITQ